MECMKGCDTAYYLVHGLNESHSFEYEEALAAQVFTRAANESGLKSMIYLGGLGPAGELSPHLRSRFLTGEILRLGRARVIEFRASIVLGQGSTSYEILRALSSRLPFFVDPKNLRAECQPIYLEDLLRYLLGALDMEGESSRVLEIGGPDRISYPDLLLQVANHSGIHRKVIPVPDLDPRLMAEAFELVVPEYARVGRHLIESLTYPTLVEDDSASRVFPEIKPIGIQESLDAIGTLSSDLGALVSKEHTRKVLQLFVERFPNLRWLTLLSDKLSV
jgi:uncharacterized protein YbjT (DUF2867 family)